MQPTCNPGSDPALRWTAAAHSAGPGAHWKRRVVNAPEVLGQRPGSGRWHYVIPPCIDVQYRLAHVVQIHRSAANLQGPADETILLVEPAHELRERTRRLV